MICLMRLEDYYGEQYDETVIECNSIEEARAELRKAFLIELFEHFNGGRTSNSELTIFLETGNIEYNENGAYIEYSADENVRWVFTDEEGFVNEALAIAENELKEIGFNDTQTQNATSYLLNCVKYEGVSNEKGVLLDLINCVVESVGIEAFDIPAKVV